MTYRVVFAKRFQSDGRESLLDPTAELDVYLPDGVVADKAFVQRLEPEAQHNQEVLDEDDAFLGMASAEVWEYDVINERAQEFEDAVRNSQTVMELEVIDESVAEADELAGAALGDGDSRAAGQPNAAAEVTRGGSGVRSIDDGPGGQPTGDPSAGGIGPGRPYMGLDEVEGISDDGGGGIDDLTIVSADDPRLGLTNYGDKGPEDWAADVGPSRVPDRGIASDSQSDEGSTLAPDEEPAEREK